MVNKEYEDLIERFEEWIDPDELKAIKDEKDPFILQRNLDKWFPKWQPTQRQTNIFSDKYETGRVTLAPDTYVKSLDFGEEGYYDRDTKVYANYERNKNYADTEEVVYHYKYGDRVVVRNKLTGGVLKHIKDLKTGEYLGSSRRL